MDKKKIIIDLDVIAVAEWDKSPQGAIARAFIERVKNKKFYVFTPYIIFDLINDWKHISLVKKIKEFYELYSLNIISVLNLEEKITELNFNRKALVSDLKLSVIKEEDIILVIMSSVFNIDCLVTFNIRFNFPQFIEISYNSYSHPSLDFISQFNQFISSHTFRIFHSHILSNTTLKNFREEVQHE